MAIQDQTINNHLIARGIVDEGVSAKLNNSSAKSRSAYGKKQTEITARTASTFSSADTGGFATDAANQLTRSPTGETPVMVNSEFEVSAPPTVDVADTSGFVSSVEELEYDMGSAERPISEMIVHWSETFSNANLTGDNLEELTGAGGNAFHYIIRRDGSVERGVPIKEAGSHTEGHNKYSIGVCLVGGVLPANEEEVISSVNEKMSSNTLTRSQYNTLYQVFRVFFSQYPGAQALGHSDVDPTAEGPGFEVQDYVRNLFGKVSLYTDPTSESEKSPDDILESTKTNTIDLSKDEDILDTNF